MTSLRLVADIIADTILLALAVYACWRALCHVRGVLRDRTPPAPVDPVDTVYWDVLADARRITENGDTCG